MTDHRSLHEALKVEEVRRHGATGLEYVVVKLQVSRLVGEEVVVILDAGNLFLVCTSNRGVLRGNPVMVGKHCRSDRPPDAVRFAYAVSVNGLADQ